MSEEIKLEYEITQIQKNTDDILIISRKMPYDKVCEFQIDFTYHIDNKEYIFIVEISLTAHQIHLYSKTLSPFNDGRDLIREVYPSIPTSNYYTPQTKLMPLLPAIKSFIEKTTNDTTKIGRFYLEQKYDLSLVSSLTLNTYNSKVRQIEMINSKKVETLSHCVISDEFFTLYEYGQREQNKITLVFYAALKCLVSFRKSLEGNVITLVWRQMSGINFEMKLTSVDAAAIDGMVETLIAKIKKVGLTMDIKKHMEGELPKVDITKLEKEIAMHEKQLSLSGNYLLFNKLLHDYEKAVEFYSAINNDKYEIYAKKIKDILQNEKFKKFYIK